MMRVAILVAAFTLAVSCSDATAPLVGARYALQSIGGDALPTNSVVNSGVMIIADTITFLEMSESGGRVEHRQTAQLPEPEPAIVRSVFEEEFTRAGDALGFLPNPCPANANCAFIPHHARFSADTLVMSYESDLVRSGHRYRRVP